MVKVTVIAMGSVREALGGWGTRTVEVSGSVKDLLLTLKTKEGTSLYELMVDPDGTKDRYLIRWVRGDLRPSNLIYQKDLEMQLEDGDRIWLLDNPPVIIGG
ncbi:MAG: hypothetical protein QXK20_04965 [Nitrososphaerales archaeon]